MSKDPLTVTLSTPLTEAIGMMVEHSIRHLPVVDGQEAFVGMVSDRDIRTTVGDPVRALCDDAYGPAAELTVEDAMGTEPLVRVGPDEPLSVLAWGFVDQRVGAVAVTDEDDRVVGIVSYVDLLHRTLGDRTLGG
jgi:CBS domain-containing protein